MEVFYVWQSTLTPRDLENQYGPKDTGWYYWDEHYQKASGPFLTESEAKFSLESYKNSRVFLSE